MARCMQIRCTLQTSPRQLSGPISFNWMGHFLQQLPLSPGQESLLHHAWAEQVLLAVHRVICQTQAKCNTGLHSTKTPIRAEWSLEISAQPPWHCHMKRPPVERGVGACTPCCLSTCWALTVWRPYILFMSRTHSLLYLPTVQGLGMTLPFDRLGNRASEGGKNLTYVYKPETLRSPISQFHWNGGSISLSWDIQTRRRAWKAIVMTERTWLPLPPRPGMPNLL